MIDREAIRLRWDADGSKRDERGRRLFAASEARAAGWGGRAVVCEITGLAQSTIGYWLAELDAAPLDRGRVRRSGGGRKVITETDPTVVEDLRHLVEAATMGDPMRPLLWVSKSHEKLAAQLAEMGHDICPNTVGRLLTDELEFSRQANRKTLEGSRHHDRVVLKARLRHDAQFEHINAKVLAAQAAGQPVISVDTKKKEAIGTYKNGGTNYRPKGCPIGVNVHDFVDKELGKVAPYGIYDSAANEAWVSVGITSDTAEFAVQSIRMWRERMTPILFGVLDDRSRLACHLQWYLAESAEVIAHGLSQAFQKRGLPRAALSDNGAAMTAAEITQGLARLGILHQTTLPYSPYMNAKQEAFWGPVEGRLIAMLEHVPDLTLAVLNEATQAWVEQDYNAKHHSEIGAAPIARFLAGPAVTRDCPGSEGLRLAFTRSDTRTQRKSDGSIVIEGRRFEIPNRYRHLTRIEVRYASRDLGQVHLVDERTGAVLARLYPQDKTQNASGLRRTLDPVSTASTKPVPTSAAPDPTMPPLLVRMLDKQATTGLAPPYLPKDQESGTDNHNHNNKDDGETL